jgi:hypothetical protein
MIYVNFTDTKPSNASFISVPLHFGKSPDKFAPASGFVVLSNMTNHWLSQYHFNNPNTSDPSLIIAIMYPGALRPYFELQLRSLVENYNVTGVIVIGGKYGLLLYRFIGQGIQRPILCCGNLFQLLRIG